MHRIPPRYTGLDDTALLFQEHLLMSGDPSDGRRTRDLAIFASTELAWLENQEAGLEDRRLHLGARLCEVRAAMADAMAHTVRPVKPRRGTEGPHTALLSELQRQEHELLLAMNALDAFEPDVGTAAAIAYYRALLQECADVIW